MRSVETDFGRNVHCLLGLPFDAVDMAASVQRVREAGPGAKPCFLSTPNLNFLIACQHDEEFRYSVINSDLSVADGMPLVWLARLLGVPILERVAGSALFEALCKDTGSPMSVFFFGGPEGVAARACERLNGAGGALTCVGYECPGFGSVEQMSSQQTIDRINASGADFLVVSLGAKKGQAWIEKNRRSLDVPVISHLGAVVNFVAGEVQRAPGWMQLTGLEWLWRIKEEPALWRRYWHDGLAMIHLLISRVIPYAWHLHWHPASTSELAHASVSIKSDSDNMVISLAGAWGQQNVAKLLESFSSAAQAGKTVRVDLSGVSHLDSAFLGRLMLLSGHLRSRGSGLTISGVAPRIRRVFELSCCEFMLRP